MILTITGHRPDKLDNDYNLTGPLIKEIEHRLTIIIKKYKPERLNIGMALGIDQLCAYIAIKNNIPFWAYVPFPGQENMWNFASRTRYNFLLSKAEKVITVMPNNKFVKWAMQKRNERMVDEGNMVLAVWDGSDGGTANCVRYAQRVYVEVVQLNPNHVRRDLIAKRSK